ncbi:phosphate acyltransferase [candidate division WOR-1 bacterium RIFOXYA12_FULL_52_29]|uniref:Phosphate acyltransferase n=1 Tax=candidate division WOR-1 bacterium RIFOXYC12_FULL_54_18 TaxID=1802584 RepID=A0A1F4T841_UNCSA|nr:MAG: phosphate acyltransferase [candidate division WOR-1 bacterium RIFOXYA2_FULL_51_19]OGC18515.1 MAG: phosphate acyltransferase [candidate division WOR-1 bacterium RIFOXYA12_FULL_52_29]OGC27373.1 MAG: phosphate acyltransferase [candidate division WOR-1 bacterium RIFOXYB2_FULL_45_9]OGC28932.1 MAG: phosphate acyltransferase [candidate division WOR-1 bacterium RIFOXYC12_FULL_54_18]OGC31306.1 MAG: phosphate acyltransferase [candidate division WOR-1 bacterium RIFOXYB12_FULL_52_16]
MRIAIDAMGGDFAPSEIVKGAVQASLELPVELILVGKADKINKELSKYKKRGALSVVNAEEVIANNEAPVSAVKQKKDSSLNVAVSLVKKQEAAAVVSAGNTGALMTASLFGLGRIPGIERPAIAGLFPTKKRPVLVLDIGANSDCKAKQLKQFAEMGAQYCECVMHYKSPRVGLLNIGEEKEKGNELVTEAWPLLKDSPINFLGNVEPKEMFAGEIDVVVCDGFVGNLILKYGESVSSFLLDLFKKELTKNPITYFAAFLLLPAFAGIKKRTDYDEYGGAPMLGINGVVFKAHGRAKAKAFKNAIRATMEAVQQDLVGRISKIEAKQ